jgi:hypothetical protein
MRLFKKILILLLIAFIVIQFFHPGKNSSAAAPVNSVSKNFPVPDDVAQILAVACYDCHSNNTRYPWYSHIQPVAWWLNNHIQEGKKHLDFDEFATYPLRRQYGKFDQTIKVIKKDEMPLPSYLIIHRDAVLSPEQKEKVIAWSKNCMDAMKAAYPIDSLVKK